MQNTTSNTQKIFTLPNIMSMVRFFLIPIFVHLYIVKEDYAMTAAVITLSALTDIADGFIARRFNMMSELGKALDPIADKLTQAAMLFCLLSKFPQIMILLILLIIKEIITAATSIVTIRRTKKVLGAAWHGKLTTTLLYITMVSHIIFPAIPHYVSFGLIILCTVIMIISFTLYITRNLRAIKDVSDDINNNGVTI